MKSSKALAAALVVLLVIAVGALTYNYLSSTKTTIYVFRDNYPAGVQITEGMLAAIEVDSQAVAGANMAGAASGAAYVTAKEKGTVLKDAFLRTDVFKGMAFMKNQTEKFGGTPGVVRLAPHMVAITIDADNASAGSPAIKPGARVNVYAGYDTGDETSGSKMEVLMFQNIQVVDVFYGENASSSGSLPIAGVTLEVPAEESAKLAFAAQFGKIRLGQVKTGQYKEIPSASYTMQDVLAAPPDASRPTTAPNK